VHVIFLAPNFPASQPRFVRGLKSVGARVTGIGDTPVEALPRGVRDLLDGYEYVRSVGDVEAVTEAVRRIQRRGPWVHRFEATIESHMLVAAAAREATGIPGLPVQTVDRCRDKLIMKQFLRAKGIPCAANGEVNTGDEARAFAKQHGYPLILKPRDGAGAAGTTRMDDEADLERAIAEANLDRQRRFFTIETFVTGHEGFYDTLTVNGEVVFDTICHYYPNVLEAMRTAWISPQIVMTNRVEASGYQELRRFGREVISALELGTTATHMEWFASGDGIKFSEIGARPPGCNTWDLYSAANDLDLYQEWARAICWGTVAARPSRRFSAGLISLRPNRSGTIRGVNGLDELKRKYGRFIHDAHFPSAGSATAPVEAGYLAHGWVRVLHPDYDACRAMLDDIGRMVQVVAS
jgi:hypothetical protein